jgi:cytochrome b subunit of formate dehydrogenase
MINRKTISGLILCLTGVSLVKLQNFIHLTDSTISIIFCIGVIISFSGLACFASGLKTRVIVKYKICPKCFYKNDIYHTSCKKCRKPFP